MGLGHAPAHHSHHRRAVGNDGELFELLHHRLGTRQVFPISIGSTSNNPLMPKATEFGRGFFTDLGNTGDMQDWLEILFGQLSSPCWRLSGSIKPVGKSLEHSPSQIADLYDGEPIVLATQARSLPSQVVLHGRIGSESWSLPISLKQAAAQRGLSVYWADRLSPPR